MTALIIIALVLGAGYLVSLRIHPLRRCPVCRSTGRHFGSFYPGSYRRCRACGGTTSRPPGPRRVTVSPMWKSIWPLRM